MFFLLSPQALVLTEEPVSVLFGVENQKSIFHLLATSTAIWASI